MMLSKLFAPLVVVDVSGRSGTDRSRPILSRVLDATNHRGSSIKLVRRKKTRSRLNSERLTYSLPLILASQLSPSILFFSSRSRLTIFDCDWSSDVCSSDLTSSLVADCCRATGTADGMGTTGDEVCRENCVATLTGFSSLTPSFWRTKFAILPIESKFFTDRKSVV